MEVCFPDAGPGDLTLQKTLLTALHFVLCHCFPDTFIGLWISLCLIDFFFFFLNVVEAQHRIQYE